MADLSESQQKRAKARERRRKQPDDPGLNDGAENRPQDNEQLHHAARQAAKGAVAAAAVGAAAAAARKLATRDGEHPEAHEQPEPAQEPEREQPEAQEPDSSEREPDTEPQREAQREPVAGAPQGDARRVLDHARQELEDLLGRPVESASALERTHDGWVLALEVVEVNRVPETMDVLASYEVELDDDLNLRRYERARRYHRARSDTTEDA